MGHEVETFQALRYPMTKVKLLVLRTICHLGMVFDIICF